MSQVEVCEDIDCVSDVVMVDQRDNVIYVAMVTLCPKSGYIYLRHHTISQQYPTWTQNCINSLSSFKRYIKNFSKTSLVSKTKSVTGW